MTPATQRRLPLFATAGVFLALFIIAGAMYPGFFSTTVFGNIFIGYAMLGIAAVGMTLVIFTGGIDLSVGSVIGFTSIFTASLVQDHGLHPAVASTIALAAGTLFGAMMGTVIHVFRQPPFLITLAGLFLMRGLGFWITTDQIEIAHNWTLSLSEARFALGGLTIRTQSVMLLVALGVGGVLAHYTRFGRSLLAIGGNEPSAVLMGLPVGKTKIAAYTCSGFCAAWAGLVETYATSTGNPSLGLGLELEAIAVVVIGGTLLTGGRGHMLGTALGVLVYGTIQTALYFQPGMNPAYLRIIVGALLLGFILLQRLIVTRIARS